MTPRLLAALALVALTGGNAAGQPAAPTVSRYQLPNGVRLLVREEARPRLGHG